MLLRESGGGVLLGNCQLGLQEGTLRGRSLEGQGLSAVKMAGLGSTSHIDGSLLDLDYLRGDLDLFVPFSFHATSVIVLLGFHLGQLALSSNRDSRLRIKGAYAP